MKNELIFDFTNVSENMIGDHGISDHMLATLQEKIHMIHEDLKERRETGQLPFMELPYSPVDNIISFAERAQNKFETFVNVGIGGSALGAQSLVMALCHPFHNIVKKKKSGGLQFFVADNIDPDYLSGMLDVLNPGKTLFNIITKSGSTAETMGTFLIVKNFLEKTIGAKWHNNIVITTDAVKGDLRKIAQREKIESFVVPDGVGGRFSVLSPVGLIPAACAGIDIQDLLEGAAQMDTRLKSVSIKDNPVYLYSTYHFLLNRERGKSISVMMPYSSLLYGLADWYRQLWAESLGKKVDIDGKNVFTGQTPIKALGVTDQHSQTQLYVEGPFDKVFTILAVSSFTHKLPMESAYSGTPSLDYLGGHTMAELIEAERLGTTFALTKNHRPNITITFPEITPHTVGQFLYAFEVAIVFSGGLYHINPLDQPGVEEGKRAAFALMGRPGYEAMKAEIQAGLSSRREYIK